MTNGSWESEAAPRKKGMPLWAKIGLGCVGGCALVFVLLIVTCVGGAHWISQNGLPGFVDKAVGSAFLDQAWSQMQQTVKALRTEEGTRALYRENPGLKENYPEEATFLHEAQNWRKKLGQFPTARPSLNELIKDHKEGGAFHISNTNERTQIDYQIPEGGLLHLELVSEKLVNVRVE